MTQMSGVRVWCIEGALRGSILVRHEGLSVEYRPRYNSAEHERVTPRLAGRCGRGYVAAMLTTRDDPGPARRLGHRAPDYAPSARVHGRGGGAHARHSWRTLQEPVSKGQEGSAWLITCLDEQRVDLNRLSGCWCRPILVRTGGTARGGPGRHRQRDAAGDRQRSSRPGHARAGHQAPRP